MDFVNALNAVRGPVWLVFLTLVVALFLYVRYRNTPATGDLIEALNSIHPAVYGFVLCLWAIVLMLNGHEEQGDKIFLSGASFIGGVALRGQYNGNGTVNGAPQGTPTPTK